MSRLETNRIDGQGERGSILVALLSVLIVSALMVTLTATVITGQRQTSFDQNFEQSVHIAEVGLDRGTYRVRQDAITSDESYTETVDGGSYQVDITRDTADPMKWTVTSTGTAADGSVRVLQVDIDGARLFPIAFFADQELRNNGNSSYCRQQGGCVNPSGLPPNIDGLAGSNNLIRFNGYPSMSMGKVVLADWDANPDNDRCPGGTCDPDSYELRSQKHEIRTPRHDEEVADLVAECADTYQSLTTVWGTIDPGVYCLNSAASVTLRDIVVAGSTGDVKFVYNGTGTVTLGRNVNTAGSATRLQVFSNTTPTFQLTSNSNNRLLVYAPEATCEGQGNITLYGGMICSVINIGGNTHFYAPEDLARVGIGDLTPHNWREN